MKKFVTVLTATAFTAAYSSAALASPDVYVVNFRSDKSVESQVLDNQLSSALSMVPAKVEKIDIDTSNAAKWEKSAHDAFNNDIVPVFNKWVGLPGFAAIVDARTKRVIGCVNNQFQASEIAREIGRMSDQAKGMARMSNASFTKTTACPPAHNLPPK